MRLLLILAVPTAIVLSGGGAQADRWTGTSDGGTKSCLPLRFTITVAGGRVSGDAYSDGPHGRMHWVVSGTAEGGTLRFRASHHRASRNAAHSTSWTGEMAEGAIKLRQVELPRSCRPGRAATLRRA